MAVNVLSSGIAPAGDTDSPRTWLFSEFEFDPARGALSQAGQAIVATRLSLSLLEYFLNHADRVITRDELMKNVWSDVVVSEGAVRQAVSDLRRALGDRLDIIRTVRGKGYQFAARAVEHRRSTQAGPSSTPAAPARGASTFCGRARELAELERALGAAAQNEGLAWVIQGPAGIGKSRLARELVQTARRRGIACFQALTDADGAAPALWPWREILRQRIDSLSGSRRAMEARFRRVLRRLDGARTAPFSEAPASEDAPAQQRFALFAELGELFAAAFGKTPALVLLEDLQWADEASLALLCKLAGVLPTTRCLLVITVRNDQRAKAPLRRALQQLRRASLNQELELSTLSEEETAALVAPHLARQPAAGTVERIWALSGGNPLFARELAQLFARLGGLPAALATDASAPLDYLLQHRLRALPDEVQGSLTVASVLGVEFSVAELAHLACVSAEQALQRIERCAEYGLLDARDADRFAFAPPALREAAYGLLPVTERARLHRRAGDFLERVLLGTSAERLHALAHHFALAAPTGCAGKAARYALACAEHAYANAAYRDALNHYDRALTCMDRDAASGAPAKLALALERGEALRASGADTGQVNRYFLELAEQAEALDEPQLFARAVLGYMGQRRIRCTLAHFPAAPKHEQIALIERALTAVGDRASEARVLLLCALAGALLYGAERARCARAVAEAHALASELGVPWLQVRVLGIRIHCCGGPENASARLEDCDAVVRLAAAHGLPAQEADGLVTRALIKLHRADLTGAEEDIARARALAREVVRWPSIRARSELLELMRAFWEGDCARAEQLARSALDAAPDDLAQQTLAAVRFASVNLLRTGDIANQIARTEEMLQLYPEAIGLRCALASSYVAVGELERARMHFDAVTTHDFAFQPAGLAWLTEMCWLADAAFHLDDAQRAALVYARLEPFGDLFEIVLGEGLPLGPVAFWLAALAIARRDFGAAKHWLAAARDMNQKLGAIMFEHYARLLEARLIGCSEPHALHRASALLEEVTQFARARSLLWLRSRAALELARIERLVLDVAHRSPRLQHA